MPFHAHRRLRLVVPLVLYLLLSTGQPAAAAPEYDGLPTAGATGPPSGDGAVAPGALWGWPLPGVPAVSRRFDAPDGRYAAGHRGVDLVGAPGTVVTAAGAGIVLFAGMVAGRPVVSVDHPGGLRTTYEPVQATVGAGRPVSRGEQLGVLMAGHPGCPAVACLHWGLKRGDTYLDPLTLLAPPRVRLLPWT